MHPAFSVLFFTVTSGFGYGFLWGVIAAYQSGYIEFVKTDLLTNSSIAIALFTIGLLSSTLHLAKPANAWRSFARFRSSWLSREGVLAVLAYPLIVIYLTAIYFDYKGFGVTVLAWLILLLIPVLQYCTGMIYASLKTIPQWNNRCVPINFIVFALASGLLCLGVATGWWPDSLRIICVIVLIVSLVLKLFYFRSLGQPSRSNINTATSFSQAKVTLFDVGHSSENFTQREFIYEVGPKTIGLARITSLLLAFGLPILFLLLDLLFTGGTLFGGIALFSLYSGLLLERWLFFVEAKHVVRYYYGKG